MKRPAFQFYPADWRKDSALQSCSLEAQGLWINLICIAHECEPYGHLTVNGRPMTVAQIARLVGVSAKDCERMLAEVVDAGVVSVKGCGTHYSRRMVRDEELREVRAEAGRASGHKGAEHGAKGAEHGVKGGRPSSNNPGNNPPSHPPVEPGQNPHPSSSSSSSSSSKQSQKISPSDLSSAGAEDANRPAEPVPFQPIVDLYNEICGDLFPEVLKITDARRKAIRARWHFDTKNEREKNRTNSLDYWRRYFTCCLNIEFFRKAAAGEHRGEHAGWVPGFDYLMRETTLLGVLEGKLK